MRCSNCNKKCDKLHKSNSLNSLTEGYCEDCIKKINKKDLELLEAIRKGRNLSEFLEN